MQMHVQESSDSRALRTQSAWHECFCFQIQVLGINFSILKGWAEKGGNNKKNPEAFKSVFVNTKSLQKNQAKLLQEEELIIRLWLQPRTHRVSLLLAVFSCLYSRYVT